MTTKTEVRKWERENRRERRRRFLAETRCFFTRPFGHAYVNHECVSCGRRYPLNF